MTLIRYIFLLLLLLPTLSWSQTSFVTQAPKNIGGQERFYLQFILTNASGESFVPPSLKDFEVLAGPNFSNISSLRSINGKVTSVSTETYAYLVVAKKYGNIQVGSASITVNGKRLKTKPLIIHVSPTRKSSVSSSPSFSSSLSREKQKDKLFFTTHLSRRTVYEQEPVMLNCQLHVRTNLRLNAFTLNPKPDLKGFWTQEIEQPRNISLNVQEINGKYYGVGNSLQYLLFPQQVGRLTIPSFNFECEVIQARDDFDEIDAFFNGIRHRGQRWLCSTEETTLEVLPLPSPRPSLFSGAVGKMTISGKWLSDIPKTNDVATYRITIKGSGNLKLLKAPKLELPANFDSYPAKSHDQTEITTKGISGEVHFDYTFVPHEVGDYTIPPVILNYFDTSTKQYTTIQTQPLALKVLQGRKSKKEAQNELNTKNEILRSLHTHSNSPTATTNWLRFGSWSYWVLLCSAILIVLGVWFYTPRLCSIKHPIFAKQKRQRLFNKFWQQIECAKDVLNTPQQQQFYTLVETAILTYFSDYTNTKQIFTNKEQLFDALHNNPYAKDLLALLHLLFQDLDLGRFSPTQISDLPKRVLQRIEEIISLTTRV